MTNLYVPDNTYSCYVVYDKDTIRAYSNVPTYDTYVPYVDYFVNSHYMEKTGFQYFGNYSTIPTCLNSSVITNDFYYRNDLSDILFIFLIFVIFSIYLPFRIFIRLYKRGKL